MATQVVRAREEARVILRECDGCGVLGVPEGALDVDTSDLMSDTFPVLMVVPNAYSFMRGARHELRCLECAG